MINNKFEEKTCGDGPSLSTMFSDDKNMQSLIENIQVRVRPVQFTANPVQWRRAPGLTVK